MACRTESALGACSASVAISVLIRRNADYGRCCSEQIRRIKIIVAGDADQREQGVAPGVAQRGPHRRCGVLVWLVGDGPAGQMRTIRQIGNHQNE